MPSKKRIIFKYMNIRNKGFSLIFVSVLLIVAGAVITSLMQISPNSDDIAAEETNRRLKEIRYRTIAYKTVLNNPAYPCPASSTALITNTDLVTGFGVSKTDCTVAGTVMFGAVPTRTLGLPYYYAFDGWGRRFLYMTTVGDTAGITAANIPGTGNVNSFTENYLDMSSLTLAIISHGKDGLGAYNKAGTLKACSSSNADKENCDGDANLIYDRWQTGYDDLMTGIRAD